MRQHDLGDSGQHFGDSGQDVGDSWLWAAPRSLPIRLSKPATRDLELCNTRPVTLQLAAGNSATRDL